MKTTAVGFLLALTLTGCTIERTVVQEPTETTSTSIVEITAAPTQPPKPRTSESEFIDAMHSSSPDSKLVGDSMLIDTGRATCEAFESGLTLTDVLITIIDSSDGDESVQELLQWVTVNAIIYLCPKFIYLAEEI